MAIEALACGVPVVATRTGETRGMLLYDFGNIDQLTSQLKQSLFGDQTVDVAHWAALYQKEAEENLEALIRNLALFRNQ